MDILSLWAALHLLVLTGPDGQLVVLNPDHIVSLRDVRVDEHFAKGTRCIVHTDDGKFLAVAEDCDTIRRAFDAAEQGNN